VDVEGARGRLGAEAVLDVAAQRPLELRPGMRAVAQRAEVARNEPLAERALVGDRRPQREVVEVEHAAEAEAVGDLDGADRVRVGGRDRVERSGAPDADDDLVVVERGADRSDGGEVALDRARDEPTPGRAEGAPERAFAQRGRWGGAERARPQRHVLAVEREPVHVGGGAQVGFRDGALEDRQQQCATLLLEVARRVVDGGLPVPADGGEPDRVRPSPDQLGRRDERRRVDPALTAQLDALEPEGPDSEPHRLQDVLGRDSEPRRLAPDRRRFLEVGRGRGRVAAARLESAAHVHRDHLAERRVGELAEARQLLAHRGRDPVDEALGDALELGGDGSEALDDPAHFARRAVSRPGRSRRGHAHRPQRYLRRPDCAPITV
jgi:hypothetical protein